jgi:hypothetical protein
MAERESTLNNNELLTQQEAEQEDAFAVNRGDTEPPWDKGPNQYDGGGAVDPWGLPIEGD